MDILSIIMTGIGLAMDAFAVSITNGIIIKNLKLFHSIRIALSFGIFQAVMPIIGWKLGNTINEYIKKIDHWIAFFLLVIIGIKMILESKKILSDKQTKNCTNFTTLILLSIATSIDAFAVGLSFSFLNISILLPVVLIGIITFILSFIGTQIGKKIGHLFESKIEIFGGIILIIIGCKILIEHLSQ